MHIAAANGYSKVVEFLLENHAAVDNVDKDMWTPVHAAACWGHVSNAHSPPQGLFTRLSAPIFQMDILEMLAMSGADLNAKNKNDETPSGEC